MNQARKLQGTSTVKIFARLIILFVMLLAGQAMAANCTALTGAQNWDTKGSWTDCGGKVPQNGDTVVIPGGSTVTLDKDSKKIASLTVAAGGTLLGDADKNKLKLDAPGNLTNNGTITLNTAEIDMKGNLVNTGIFNAGSDTLKLDGNFSNTGTFNAQTGEVEFDGNAVQTVTGNVTFNDLKVDNGSNNGLLLQGNVIVSGSLSGNAVSGGLVYLADTCPVDYTLTSNNGKTVQHSCPKPVAEYRFDEVAGSVVDSSPNALTGSVNGGVTRGGAGKVCGSYKFNGTNAFVSVPHNALLNLSQATVMAWVRHSGSIYKNWEAIVTKGDNTYRLHLHGSTNSIYNNNTRYGMAFAINGGGAAANINSGQVPGDAIWYHLAGTYDGTTIKVYVNGTLTASKAYSQALNSNNLALMIGENAGARNRYFKGDIDEVKIYNAALTAAQISAGFANENAGKNWDGSTRDCAVSGPDHLEIQSSGSGLTCAASTLTVRACADAACNTLYTGGVSGTLTSTAAVNWDGSTGGASGAGFVIPAGSSSVTKNVQVTTAGSVVLGVTSPTTPAATNATTCNFGSPSCTFMANDAGFIFDVPHHVSEVMQAVNVSAVKTADNSLACVPAFASVSKNVTFKCSYAEPSSGTLPVRVNGTALNAAANAGASCDASGKAVSLAFGPTGVASTTFQYADAGNINLTATYTGSGSDAGLIMTGSDAFIAAPKDFAFSAVTPGPIKAGINFSATVTARNNADAVTPNFINQTVTITSTNPLPAPGNATPINTALTGFSSGAATSTNLVWNEVGTVNLNANLNNYLGSNLSVSGTHAAAGRFTPDHFDTAIIADVAPIPCPAGLTCPTNTSGASGMVYANQPIAIQVTAKNASGGPTANYQGAFAKENTFSAWSAAGGAGTTNPGGGIISNTTLAATDFSAGVGVTPISTPNTTRPTYALATVTTAPTDVYFRAVDTDGITSLRASPVEAGLKVANGRIHMPNVYGSERLPLPLPVTVQYYDGSRWLTSLTDNVTFFDTHLATATPAGNLVVAVVTGLSGGITVSNPGTTTVAFGVSTITLAAPSVSGSANISLNAPSYLPSAPARATFGIYKSSLIYRRENY